MNRMMHVQMAQSAGNAAGAAASSSSTATAADAAFVSVFPRPPSVSKQTALNVNRVLTHFLFFSFILFLISHFSYFFSFLFNLPCFFLPFLSLTSSSFLNYFSSSIFILIACVRT